MKKLIIIKQRVIGRWELGLRFDNFRYNSLTRSLWEADTWIKMLICKCTTQGTIWEKNWKSSWSGLDEGNLQENGEINKTLTIYSINLRFILEWIENWELLWCAGQYLSSPLDSSYSLPLQMFLLPHSFSCLSVTPTKCILDNLIMSHTSRTFCSVFCHPSSWSFLLNYLQIHWYFLFLGPVM